MPFIYRISRREVNRPSVKRVAEVVEAAPVPEPEPEPLPEPEPPPSYRDLQGQAKELGISAKQTAEELKKAISEAENG